MTRWPIQRNWTVNTDGKIIDVPTEGLTLYRSCALLGAAGLGKTFEIEHLAEFEQAAGREIRKARFADLAQSADVLVARLDALAADATANTAIYLDALDEVKRRARAIDHGSSAQFSAVRLKHADSAPQRCAAVPHDE